MKASPFVTLLIVLMTISAYAQPPAKGKTSTDLASQVDKEAKKLFPMDNTCSKAAKAIMDMYDATPYTDRLEPAFRAIGDDIERMQQKAKDRGEAAPFDQGFFRSLEERVFSAYSSSKDVNTFVKRLTGKNLTDHNNHKDFSELYNRIKNMEKSLRNIALGHDNIISEAASSLSGRGNCNGGVTLSMGIQKFGFPFTNWIGSLEFNFTCDCDKNDPSEVKSLIYVVQFTAQSAMGSFDYKVKEKDKEVIKKRVKPFFQDARNFKIKEHKIVCCDKKDDEDASYMSPIGSPDEYALTEDELLNEFISDFLDEMDYLDDELDQEIDDFLAGQYINTGFGLGYNGGQDELSTCVMLGYSNQVHACDKAALYAGGMTAVNYSTQLGSSSDFSSFDFVVGPTLDMYFPVKDGPVSFKTGLVGGFGIGNEKFSSFTQKKNIGYFNLTTGVNISFDALDLCFEMPIFQFEHVKFKDDFLDNTENNIGFNLNKHMPFKAVVNIPIGEK